MRAFEGAAPKAFDAQLSKLSLANRKDVSYYRCFALGLN
jgi:hypothetical protein